MADYTYQLLPPVPADSEQKPLYIGNTRYDPPYNNLPLFRANVHPAFVFCALKDYVTLTFNVKLDATPLIDTPLRLLVYRIMGFIRHPIPVTWTHGTYKEFLHRGLIPVKDLPKKPRRTQPSTIDDGYQTPEERDYKLDDPRMVKRQKKMRNYMEANNERSTALAKGNASDIKKHHNYTVVANVVAAETAKRARSLSLSQTEPVEEPPSKRSKTQSKKARSSGKRESTDAITPPNYLPTPPLRRSTRKPKNPPKYK